MASSAGSSQDASLGSQVYQEGECWDLGVSESEVTGNMLLPVFDQQYHWGIFSLE